MVVFGGLLDLVIVVFLVLVFAEYVKIRTKADKPFRLVASAGVLALLAAGSSLLEVAGPTAVFWIGTIFSVISWILLLIGTLWATAELSKK